MQTVILAGGMGTRLAAVACGLPKAMIPVMGRPFIEHQLALLARQGLHDVVLCVGHGADRIERHVGDGERFGVAVQYAREDPGHLMGTGGALVNALPVLKGSFLVMYGDSYLPMDFQSVVRAFHARMPAAMMCVFQNKGRWDRSNVRIHAGQVVFYSKTAAPGETDYIDYGLSAMRREVIERYRTAPMPLDLGRIQSDLVQRGEMAAFEVEDRFYEIGRPEGLAELEREMQRWSDGAMG